MKNQRTITFLLLLVIAFSSIATTIGIFSHNGAGPYPYKSIRGKDVTIYGKGLYRDMSAEVAPQGIAQDYVTLLVGIPLLLVALWLTRSGSKKGWYLLAGTLGYFLVTYLFYTVMGMYNKLFLVYVLLMGASFYGFILMLLSFDTKALSSQFKAATPFKLTGSFLIFNAVVIALLWLSIVVPPLLNGTIIPIQVEHYTTLIVQGLDLGILLPAAFVCGVLWIKRTTLGYLLAPIYFVFLSILMITLTAKVIAMALLGYHVIPVIFIIPTFNVLTIISTVAILKNIVGTSATPKRNQYEKAIVV